MSALLVEGAVLLLHLAVDGVNTLPARMIVVNVITIGAAIVIGPGAQKIGTVR